MKFFDKAEKILTETGQGMERKAKNLAETVRLKNMIHTCQEVIDQNYKEIGKSYFEANKDNADNPYADNCKAIADAMTGMEALKKQLEELE